MAELITTSDGRTVLHEHVENARGNFTMTPDGDGLRAEMSFADGNAIRQVWTEAEARQVRDGLTAWLDAR